MKINKLEQNIKIEMEEHLDELFPKGKTRSRGPALVMFAYFMIKIHKLVAAFGGCIKCYGKGYGTQTMFMEGAEDFGGDGFPRTKMPTTVFCSCERGKQLRKLFADKESVHRILLDELNLAHTAKAGKTSRITSAINRISKL
jgi:hypothetical protein